MANLEPIEDKDLDLKSKFSENKEKVGGDASSVEKKEEISSPEIAVERKEGAVEKDEAYSKILSKVKTTQPADDSTVKTDAASANLATDTASKVEKLIQLAEQKGVYHAVKVARHMEDNYTLDEFHDSLLGDELHNALVQKGLIEEI